MYTMSLYCTSSTLIHIQLYSCRAITRAGCWYGSPTTSAQSRRTTRSPACCSPDGSCSRTRTPCCSEWRKLDLKADLERDYISIQFQHLKAGRLNTGSTRVLLPPPRQVHVAVAVLAPSATHGVVSQAQKPGSS